MNILQEPAAARRAPPRSTASPLAGLGVTLADETRYLKSRQVRQAAA